MIYYVVEMDDNGRTKRDGVSGPFRAPPQLGNYPSAMVIEIADGGTVERVDGRTIRCSGPHRVTVVGGRE